MSYKPILFSTPMVEAILEGRKTQTRRIIKPQPEETRAKGKTIDHVGDYSTGHPQHGKAYYWKDKRTMWNSTKAFFPRYQKGDILWVREAFQQVWKTNDPESDDSAGISDFETRDKTPAWGTHENYWIYRAGGIQPEHPEWGKLNWLPSIHMPKEACRLFLEIIDFHAEQLHFIAHGDIRREGLLEPKSVSGHPNPGKDSWRELWISINGKESWEANPWVWVYDFKRIDKPANWPA